MIALGAPFGLGACDVGDATHAEIDAPPLHLVEIRATTGYLPEGCLAGKRPNCTTPVRRAVAMDGSTVVHTTTSITVAFDRFLDPLTATRQSLCLRGSSLAPVTKLEDCGGQIFLDPSYDPVRREVTYRLPPGTRLQPQTTHQLTVLAPPLASKNGFRAFDGAALAGNVTVLFKTASELGAPEEHPNADYYCKGGCDSGDRGCVSDPATDCRLRCGGDADCKTGCGAKARLRLSCASVAACHQPADNDPLATAMGMDLFDTPQIVQTAIGRVAHETQEGESARSADESPLRFGRAMPRIDPGNPGNSYLLYKLLVHPDYERTQPTMAPGEVARLRASVVVGLPMPANAAKGIPVPLDSLEALSQWIAAGARTVESPACPKFD